MPIEHTSGMPENEQAKLLEKRVFPTSLKSDEIRLFWSEKFKSKIIFSAQTTSKEYLDEVKKILIQYQDHVGEFENELGETEKISLGEGRARMLLREKLNELGLIERDEEGNAIERITNLGSKMRVNLVLRTNSALAHSEAQKMFASTPSQKLLRPAWELVRNMPVKDPRPWNEIWNKAAEAVSWEGVARNTDRFIALVDSPIWSEIGHSGSDSLGVDQPPFKYGSRMMWKSITRKECVDLGLIEE